ncbi:MAG: hypothetical protein FWH48_10825, partial [Oscillospiraceae bacterium]|nr:hypothetical protein [Oscillospiraceae bacterium]
LSKTKQSLGLLEGAKSLLAKKDYKILADPFEDAVIVLGMLRRLGEAAYAANLVMDNFDCEPDPKGLLKKNIGELLDYNEEVINPRGSDLMNPPLYEAIGELARLYGALLTE